ncbi:MAG TPA: GWxTD domain-containing protein [Bacteroidota bacterium]|nr:GWxTD domain-containing protein [Bacteroidota bacterium]
MTLNSIKRTLLATVLAALVISLTHAQDDEGGRERYGNQGESRGPSGAEVVSFEPHMFAIDSASVRVDILYRVRYDFFIFTRDFSADPVTFRGHGELTIEAIDSTETSISRKIQLIVLHSSDNEVSQLRHRYYQGAASFVVHPGRYTTFYRIDDEESQREFTSRREILRVPRFRTDAIVKSTALFVEPPEQSLEKNYRAINENNASQFSKNTGVLIAMDDEDKTPAIRYSLVQFLQEDKGRDTVQAETTAVAQYFHHAIPAIDPNSNESVRYTLDSSATRSTLFFVLHTAQLQQGRYAAHIHISGRDTASVWREFTVRWSDMPLSLYDLDFAVSAMRYITTDDEYDDLRSGNRETRIKKFEAFWAKRDRTPGTAYNEVMAEYFRRVDYAFTAFRTLKEENGVLTDRGKIYILYGKPTTTERSLVTSGPPREVWTYASLNKQFIFEDPSRQGNYKLTASENR